MSTGPGRLQRRILEALRSTSHLLLTYRELSELFPKEMKEGNLSRAVKGLAWQGYVVEHETVYNRLVRLVPDPDPPALAALSRQAEMAYRTLAAVHGVHPDRPIPLTEKAAEAACRELEHRANGNPNK